MDIRNRFYKPYLHKFVIVLIDDILIHSKSKEDHEVHLKLVLELLKKERLYAKFFKCEFWLQEKIKKYERGMAQEEAFHTLKNNLCDASILSLPDGVEDFIVFYDASNQRLGEASKVENATVEMLRGLDQLMERKEDGGMNFIWVPLIGDVRTLIMDDAHASRLLGLLQQPEILDWKWDRRTMDFITRVPRSSSGYDTNWVIVDRLTKSAYFLEIQEYCKVENLARLYVDEIVVGLGVPELIITDRDGRLTSWSPVLWDEIRESRLIKPKLVQETTDKVVLIKEKLKTARDCQKSYADNRRKLLEFEVEDQVLLKVSPWKAYRLRFPEELSSVHDTFYVLNLKKCLVDANLHVPLDEIKVDKTLRFVEEPVEIWIARLRV
ncbi:putative reverse transcriptase domain-containing protein [Tanacetum coccineum]